MEVKVENAAHEFMIWYSTHILQKLLNARLEQLNELACCSVSPTWIFRHFCPEQEERFNQEQDQLHLKTLSSALSNLKSMENVHSSDLHMGHVVSLSNQVATHSSQNMCWQ